jgi:hypothetical protein
MAHSRRKTAQASTEPPLKSAAELALEGKIDAAMAEIEHGFGVLREMEEVGLIRFRDVKLAFTVAKVEHQE